MILEGPDGKLIGFFKCPKCPKPKWALKDYVFIGMFILVVGRLLAV